MNVCMMVSWLHMPHNEHYVNSHDLILVHWKKIKSSFQHLSISNYRTQDLLFPRHIFLALDIQTLINQWIHSASVLMILMGSEFLGTCKMLLTTEMLIFLSFEKYLIWNMACAISGEKSLCPCLLFMGLFFWLLQIFKFTYFAFYPS